MNYDFHPPSPNHQDEFVKLAMHLHYLSKKYLLVINVTFLSLLVLKGSSKTEGIILDLPKEEEEEEEEQEVEWSGAAFEKMKNLRILIVLNARFSTPPYYLPNSIRLLHWNGYPSESFPTGFYPKNVVVLSLPNSHLKLEMEKPLPRFVHLTAINFKKNQFITHIPDVSRVPNIRELHFDYCENLVAVHDSVGFLKRLEYLSVAGCMKLINFPSKITLPSLEYLLLSDTGIKFFPEVEGVMDKVSYIALDESKITELPHSISNLKGLEYVVAKPSSLRDLPISLWMLPKIRRLVFGDNLEVRKSLRRLAKSFVNSSFNPVEDLEFPRGGLTDEDLHYIFICFPNLKYLQVQGNNFVSLPASIKECAKLEYIDVSGCHNLREIPELPLSVSVKSRDCPSLSSETSRMFWFQDIQRWFKSWSDDDDSDGDNEDEEVIKEGGSIVRFWAREKFPVVAFTFKFIGEMPTDFDILLYINGHFALRFREGDNNSITVLKKNVLCMVPNAGRWPILDAFAPLEWNCVELIISQHGSLPKPNIVFVGSHVHRKETNMNDIQFRAL